METKTREIREHCTELNRCNQRGGRMLSIFDLLEANTLDIDLAAYLMSRISKGASFMVGALPGGAGKTTVMCALLNLVQPGCRLIAATPDAVRNVHQPPKDNLECAICHEISPGHYFAYLWDDDLRRYYALHDKGYILATNLHADDINEARDQVCRQNRVPEAHFNAFNLLIFLRVEGGFFNTRRGIDKVYDSKGSASHTLVYDAGEGSKSPKSSDYVISDLTWQHNCKTFLSETFDRGVRTIEDTRNAFLNFICDSSLSHK